MRGGSSGSGRGTPSTALRSAVRQSYARGRSTWPEIELEFDVFSAYFTKHANATSPSDRYAPDMFLACACAQGNAEALRAFEETFASDMAHAVASIDSSRAFVEDVLQAARERLFVPKGEALGKIAAYAGRASLKTWLCAVVVRLAISVRRRKGENRHGRMPPNDDRRLARGGPELDYLRRRYKDVFEDALHSAIQLLPSKQRMLLRLHWVQHMSIDKLAKVYNVGRSTAGRWLVSAHESLLEQVRRELHDKLRLTSTELDQLAGDMRSHLEISLLRLLSSSRGK